MDKHLIIETVKDIATRIAGESGIEIVHVELAGTKRDAVLRIFIDKDGGVSIEDCSNMSRSIEAVLDADEDLIPSKYVLEVSSPGIERELYGLKDFERFAGELAKVKTRTAIGDQKTFVGPIVSVEGSTITIDDRTRGKVSFDHSDVDKANLKIDLSKEFGRK